jgi:hypothetical protein
MRTLFALRNVPGLLIDFGHQYVPECKLHIVSIYDYNAVKRIVMSQPHRFMDEEMVNARHEFMLPDDENTCNGLGAEYVHVAITRIMGDAVSWQYESVEQAVISMLLEDR